MFSRLSKSASPLTSNRLADFSHLKETDIYLDAACQSLRPQPVLESMTEYYTDYNACGGRVKYAWGRRVDEEIDRTRRSVLNLLRVSGKEYIVSFTLNTTYGLNLILQQLPQQGFTKIVTSHIEHNSVFLSTMNLAQQWQVPHLVLNRRADGALVYTAEEIARAVVVVNIVSNIDARQLQNLNQLVDDVHAAKGIIILDAAQATAHHYLLLQATKADAICFSGHKMYGASLGVVVARKDLIESLQITFLGGGMVAEVSESRYTLLPHELHRRLEPGLQAWAEIISLGKAIEWLTKIKPFNVQPHQYLISLSQQLFTGLQAISGLTLLNHEATNVISIQPERQDAHRLAWYLSEAGIMTRSGYFCAHHYLKEYRGLPPLLRFSIGLHNTEQDISITISTLERIMKGLR